FRRIQDYSNKSNEFDYEDETLKINFEKMQIYKSKELIVLTANEFKVLKVLVENKGKILSRDKIIEELFMDLYDGYDRNVDTYIKNIRAKIEKNSREPEYIMTVYGAGYKFSEKN
ncbi:MAG: response regulator transcription factor, partial [Leptotrichiaceae bacterium]